MGAETRIRWEPRGRGVASLEGADVPPGLVHRLYSLCSRLLSPADRGCRIWTLIYGGLPKSGRTSPWKTRRKALWVPAMYRLYQLLYSCCSGLLSPTAYFLPLQLLLAPAFTYRLIHLLYTACSRLHLLTALHPSSTPFAPACTHITAYTLLYSFSPACFRLQLLLPAALLRGIKGPPYGP